MCTCSKILSLGQDTLDIFHLCGVFSTLSMFMVNSVSNSVIRGESFTEGVLGVGGARIWFFVGFLMGFASFIGINIQCSSLNILVAHAH